MINQHKRMAMGKGPVKRMARGGSVTPVGAGAMVAKPKLSGGVSSPLTNARRNNGVPGMKGGGMVKKGCK